MKKIAFNKTKSFWALLPLMLLLVACSEVESMMNNLAGKEITLQAYMPSNGNRTRVGLEEMKDSKDLLAQWQDDDVVQLFACQGETGVELGKIAVREISADRKRASFDVKLPATIDTDKPYTLYGFCGIDATLRKNNDGTWSTVCTADLKRCSIDNFKAPMMCRITTSVSKQMEVQFEHFGTYELLHVTNSTSRPITFQQLGYSTDLPWFLSTTKVSFCESGEPNLFDSNCNEMKESDIISISGKDTRTIVSWYMPNGNRIHGANLIANVNNAYTTSQDKKSSDVRIETEHAYHIYAAWNGNNLKFDQADIEEVRAISVVPASIDFGTVEVGKSQSSSFTVYNTGNVDLYFSVLPLHNEFEIPESGRAATLQVGESKTFSVTFTPTVGNHEFTETATITSDASNGTQYVLLSGNSKNEGSGPSTQRKLMLTTNVEGVTYSIYKQITDANDIHTNPDGWNCYRSKLTLEISDLGYTSTYTVDDCIYLDEESAHHGGQKPCLLINFKTNELAIFINSKDDVPYNYSMDGNFYISHLDYIDFEKQAVFTGRNWGWFPYFVETDKDLIALEYFSYAGYYSVRSTRNYYGVWEEAYIEEIYPDEFKAKSEKTGDVLVIYKDNEEDSYDVNAQIVNVALTSTEYHHKDTYPNLMYFTVDAELYDTKDIEEWGIYFDDRPGKLEFPFSNVSNNATQSLYYNSKEGLMQIDFYNYIVQLDDEVGIYVKKHNKSSGELKTYYGEKRSYTLRYDKKPSMVISNARVSNPEITGYTNGVPKYKSYIYYDYILEGAFWIKYVDSEVSGGDWTFEDKTMNPYWYPEKDSSGEQYWVATYKRGMDDLNHTNWRVLYLRNSKTVNSNYVNIYGEDYLTNAWVSSTPYYAMKKNSQMNKAKRENRIVGTIRSSIPAKERTAKDKWRIKEAKYKGGVIGSYRRR